MIDLKALETFVRVAHHKNFRMAAERLNATQPAISARIAGLEADLGVTLFTRTTRSVVLTDAGQVLLDYGERFLALREEMLGAVVARSRRVRRLRLGVAETIVHTWLQSFLKMATDRYPRIDFEIEVDISSQLRARLIARELDIAFLVGPVGAPELATMDLCSFQVAYLASPAIKLPKHEIDLVELAKFPLITFARNTAPYAQLEARLAAASVRHARIHASASVATIARMATAGLGIALLPPATVLAEIAHGELLMVKTTDRPEPLDFVAAWASEADRLLLGELVSIARSATRYPARIKRKKTAPMPHKEPSVRPLPSTRPKA
jgi:DNA-binding transcriptional LysR family regulator